MRAIGLGLVLTLVLLGTAVCGGGGGGSGTPAPEGATVVGTVTNRAGQPVPVVPIVVEGHAPVLTDAAGRFRVEGVSVPYTLVLIRELGQRAQVFRNLTRLDPTFPVNVSFTQRSAALSGTTSGGVGFPTPPDYVSAISVGTAQESSQGGGALNPANGDWNIPNLRWEGSLSTTAIFCALQYHHNASGLVDDITGLATLSVPIAHGESRSDFELALGPVGTAVISGTVNAPPGYTFVGKLVYLQHANGNVIPLPPDPGPLGAFSLVTVDSADVSTALIVSLVGPAGGNVVVVRADIPAPSSGLALDVPSETSLMAPSDAAVGVGYETPFTVSSGTDRLYRFLWTPQGSGPELELFTSEPSALIPDLAEYGLAIPDGETYEWACEVQGPGITVDDYAAGPQTGPLAGNDGFLQYTTTRTFTTGP